MIEGHLAIAWNNRQYLQVDTSGFYTFTNHTLENNSALMSYNFDTWFITMHLPKLCEGDSCYHTVEGKTASMCTPRKEKF